MQNSKNPANQKTELRRRLRQAREEAGLTQAEAEAYLRSQGQKVSRRTIAGWESANESRLPEGEHAAAILELYQVKTTALAQPGGAEDSPAKGSGIVSLIDRGELVAVPELDVSASCGDGGGSVDDDLMWETSLYLPASWIRHEYGVDPEDVFTIRALGDSMADTIQPGQRVLVARYHEGVSLRDGAIYALATDWGAMLKRLYFEPGNVVVASDNPKAPTTRVTLEEFEQTYRVAAYALDVVRKL